MLALALTVSLVTTGCSTGSEAVDSFGEYWYGLFNDTFGGDMFGTGDSRAIGGMEDETDPQLYWNLARSYQRTDQLELAGKYYEAALPAYSENPTFLKELINYYRETGETDKLMDELEHYLRLVPTDTEMQDLYDQYEDYK